MVILLENLWVHGTRTQNTQVGYSEVVVIDRSCPYAKNDYACLYSNFTRRRVCVFVEFDRLQMASCQII